jgi:hypothetical protein
VTDDNAQQIADDIWARHESSGGGPSPNSTRTVLGDLRMLGPIWKDIRSDKRKLADYLMAKVMKSVWIFAQPEEIQILYRFRAIVRKRCGSDRKYNDSTAIGRLRKAREHGVSDETMRDIALESYDFESWVADMDHLLEVEPE